MSSTEIQIAVQATRLGSPFMNAYSALIRLERAVEADIVDDECECAEAIDGARDNMGVKYILMSNAIEPVKAARKQDIDAIDTFVREHIDRRLLAVAETLIDADVMVEEEPVEESDRMDHPTTRFRIKSLMRIS